MKKHVVALILLLVTLPILGLTGCTVPDVNRGDVKIVMAIPEEFTAFEGDVILDEIIVVAKKDNTTIEITGEVMNGDHGEVLFKSLDAGSWSFTVRVLDTQSRTVFTGSEVVIISANTVSTESVLLTMSKATLEVEISHVTLFQFKSGSAYLIDFDGNGDLSRPFEFTSYKATASFVNITPKVTDVTFTLVTSTGIVYTGSRNAVKILPGSTVEVNFQESDLIQQ